MALNNIQLSETQYFARNWFLRIFFSTFFCLWVLLLLVEFFGLKVQNLTYSDHTFLIFTLAYFSLLTIFLIMYLKTRYTNEGIYYKLFFIQRNERFISWEEVENVEVVRYKPLKEYGGWGMRTDLSGKNGAYTVSGRYGIRLLFKSGKKLLFGTKKPDEISQYLQSIGKIKQS